MSTVLQIPHTQMVSMLMAHPIFSGLRADELEGMATDCEVRRLSPGERLFHQGEPGADLYVVLAGRFRITCSSPDGVQVVVGVVEDNGLLGEMSALDPAPRSATAIAAMESTVVRVPGARFIAMVNEGRPAARNLLKWIRGHICHRLRVLDERIDAVFTPADVQPAERAQMWRASGREER